MPQFTTKTAQPLARFMTLAALSMGLLSVSLRASAQRYIFQPFYAFSALTYQANGSATNSDGAMPDASLIRDSQGNLYGSTFRGGANGYGTLFEYTPVTNTLAPLYNFTDGSDGANPAGGLLMDSQGALYGVTSSGGAYGNGTIFEYAPGANAFTTLYSFGANLNDGTYPYAGLIMDSGGALYGTTSQGGAYGNGTIFEYTPATNAFVTLYAFSATLYVSGIGYVNNDGASPNAGLIMDSQGHLYGTTSGGGANGSGTIFEYLPGVNPLITLHTFSAINNVYTNSDGAYPRASLLMDSQGALYGTAYGGGKYGNGTIFEYTPGANAFVTLYSFGTNPGDGSQPVASLIMDSLGNLYGTASIDPRPLR